MYKAIHHVARSMKNGKRRGGTMRRRETEAGRRESLLKRTEKHRELEIGKEGRRGDERGRDEMKREVEIGKREEWLQGLYPCTHSTHQSSLPTMFA